MGSFLVRHIAQTCSSMFYLSMIGFRIRVSEGPHEFFINVYQIFWGNELIEIFLKNAPFFVYHL